MHPKTLLLALLGFVLIQNSATGQQLDSLTQPTDTGTSSAALKALSMDDLMNVVVTSVSRRPEPLGHVASAIQVITQDDIRRSGATRLPEALRLASNLQVAQVDSRQWAISARGFNSTTANKLLVLIDGRTVYTPLFSGVFWDVQDVPLADIDRIEVISGPGATLWGANAVNGVINVITKSPQDTRGLLVSGGGGTSLRSFGSARYGGSVGSTFRYRVYGKGFDREATDLPTGLDATDDWQMGQGGFRLDWDGAGDHRFSLQGDAYGGQMAQPTGEDVAVNGGNVLGRWSHSLSPTSDIRVRVYYDRTHRDVPGIFAQNLNTYDIELQHRTLLGRRHNLVWGVGYRLLDERVRNSPSLAFIPGEVSRSWYGGFVQDEIQLVPERLSLTLGTKIEHNAYTGFEVQPSGRVNYRRGRSTIWGAVSRALRAPSRIDREFFVPGQAPYLLAGGPDFQSEEEIAYEAGYRLQHRAFTVSLATFYNRYVGLRSLEQVNPPNPFPVVIGNGLDGQSYGAELATEYRIAKWWRLRGGYTELRINIWPRAGSTDTSGGSGENRTPDRQFSLRSSLDLPAGLRLDTGLRYAGRIANQQLPSYTELDARFGWSATEQLGLSVVGQNLLHRRHAEFGSPTARRQIERGILGAVEWRF